MAKGKRPIPKKQPHLRHARPTIGYLVFNLSPYQAQMWSGAVDVAQARDANLITFVGTQLANSPDFSSQASVLYDLVGPTNVDGLVLNTGSLVPYSDFTELKALVARCHPMPATSIARKVEDSQVQWLKVKRGCVNWCPT